MDQESAIVDYSELSQKEEFKDDVLSSEQIVADLAKLYHSKKWTDVTLAVKDRRFKAHRLILSTRCRYFKELFESEPDKVLFDLDSAFDPDVFEIVLEYIYSGNMVANRKISDDITEISLKLGLTELTKNLAGFSGTKLTKENVLQELQRYYGKNKAAFEHCLKFLDHNIAKIGIDDMQLLTMPFEIMNEILKRQTLGLAETEVLNLLINWRNEQELNSDRETVKRQATQLAQNLKVHLIQPEAYFTALKPTGWFSTELLWDTLAEMISTNRRYPPKDDDENPKFRPRKPGPKVLKPRKARANPSSLPNYPVAILGMEASGKTVLLYKLKLGEVVTTVPTIGFNIEEVQYKSARYNFTDCGYKVKNNWMELVSPRTAALIWVIDSNNRDADLKLEGAQLKEIFDRFGKADLPTLVFANKQDLPMALSVSQIADLMGLHHLGITNWYIQATCAVTGDGLYEGLDWLHRQLNPDDYE
jgi:ADP-ribosylation factor protein 1